MIYFFFIVHSTHCIDDKALKSIGFLISAIFCRGGHANFEDMPIKESKCIFGGKALTMV